MSLHSSSPVGRIRIPERTPDGRQLFRPPLRCHPRAEVAPRAKVGAALGVVLLAAACLPLGGCASLVKGSRQRVTITTSPPGASITVDGKPVGQGPTVALLKRDRTHVVTASLEGHETATREAKSHMQAGWILVDVLTGLAAVIVDGVSGAWQSFDQPIRLDLVPTSPAGASGDSGAVAAVDSLLDQALQRGPGTVTLAAKRLTVLFDTEAYLRCRIWQSWNAAEVTFEFVGAAKASDHAAGPFDELELKRGRGGTFFVQLQGRRVVQFTVQEVRRSEVDLAWQVAR